MIGIRIVKPEVEFITPKYMPTEWKNQLLLIEECGRVSHRSEGRMKEGTCEPFIKKIAMKYGHESIIEHGVFTVCFVCDRSCSHQIVRHRLAAYTQESQRYCDYSDTSRWEALGLELVDQDDAHVVLEDHGRPEKGHSILNVIMPHSIAGREVSEMLAGKTIFRTEGMDWDTLVTKAGSDQMTLRQLLLELASTKSFDPEKLTNVYEWATGQIIAYSYYLGARERGIPSEDARSHLTNACRTLVYSTYNFREWRHFFKMRSDSHAQWQIRILATNVLKFFKEEIPVITTGYEVNPEWL